MAWKMGNVVLEHRRVCFLAAPMFIMTLVSLRYVNRQTAAGRARIALWSELLSVVEPQTRNRSQAVTETDGR